MGNITPHLTVIVRASGEATTPYLMKQLNKQVTSDDNLSVIDNQESFEMKLKQGFEKAFKINNPFSVFIDADILVRSNVITKIRSLCFKLNDNDLGFGLRLWDRFYDQPKFRGLHIYQTKFLKLAIKHIPDVGDTIRPESFTKNSLSENNVRWNNNLTRYVAGIHDYGQYSADIFYKFLIRKERSDEKEIFKLKKTINQRVYSKDFEVAMKALNYTTDKKITNQKSKYHDVLKIFDKNSQLDMPNNIDMYLLKKLFFRYKFSHLFFKSF